MCLFCGSLQGPSEREASAKQGRTDGVVAAEAKAVESDLHALDEVVGADGPRELLRNGGGTGCSRKGAAGVPVHTGSRVRAGGRSGFYWLKLWPRLPGACELELGWFARNAGVLAMLRCSGVLMQLASSHKPARPACLPHAMLPCGYGYVLCYAFIGTHAVKGRKRLPNLPASWHRLHQHHAPVRYSTSLDSRTGTAGAAGPAARP